jgi:hypothetical protein
MTTGNETVDRVGQLAFNDVNVVPQEWYGSPLLRFDDGEVNFAAIAFLGEFVYWYRPAPIFHKKQKIGERPKFYPADKLQYSYAELVEKFGVKKSKATAVCKFLKTKGLIDLDFRTIPIPNGMPLSNVMFVGLNMDLIESITSCRTQENLVDPPPTDSGEGGIPPLTGGTIHPLTTPTLPPLTGGTYSKTEDQTEEEEPKNSVQPQHATPDTQTLNPEAAKEKTPSMEAQVDSTQILKLKKAQPTASLAGHWQKQLADQTGKFQVALTVKEKSQLKRIATGLASTPGLIPWKVLDYVLERWTKFGVQVQKEAGIKDFPTGPHIGFLDKYWMVAADMYLHSIAPKPAPAPTTQVVVIDPPKVVNDVYNPSPEEIAKLMEEFNG